MRREGGRGRRVVIRSEHGAHRMIGEGASYPFRCVPMRDHIGIDEPQDFANRFLGSEIARSAGSAVPWCADRAGATATCKLCRRGFRRAIVDDDDLTNGTLLQHLHERCTTAPSNAQHCMRA